MKDWVGVLITIIVGLFCLHGCAPINQYDIEKDYNAKIGKLRYEIDVLTADLKRIDWELKTDNDYQDERLLDLEDINKAHEKCKGKSR